MKRPSWMGWLGAVLLGSALCAQAASVSVAPSGTVSDAAKVTVVATVAHSAGAVARISRVMLDGVDVTQYFNAHATVVAGSTSTQASIPVPLGAGTYGFTVTAEVSSEGGATGATTFTVQGDEQSRRRNMVVSRINSWTHQWDERQFSRWIKLGNINTFRNRFNASEVQVFVDQAFLTERQAVAAYVESWVFPFYWRDLVLSAEPESFANGGANDAGTLWHEGIHAISHGAGGMGVDDHILIGWAEACIRGFSWLTSFEQFAVTNNFRDDVTTAATARTRWKKFIETCETGSVYGRAPTTAERAALKTMTGIDIDAQAIKTGYRGIGYPAAYFDDVQVRLTSPANGTETPQNQVLVKGSVTLSDPDMRINMAGFVVNGAAQQAPLTMSGTTGTFESTAVLKTGDNDIYAGVVTTTGDVYTSPSINVKSNALLNTYHVRITWDKNDTDVDLHFSWSGGSECYYSNKTPTWGGTAATSPRLDVDDTNGYGPENITIDRLPGSGHYRIHVHYYSDHGKGPTNVNATIYQNGVPLLSNSRTMSSGQNWTLFEFDI